MTNTTGNATGNSTGSGGSTGSGSSSSSTSPPNTQNARAFKPFGTPPPFDFDDYKDSFAIWEEKWKIFLDLSTINTALPAGERKEYRASTLKSCLSTSALQAVLSMGLTEDELKDDKEIVAKLKERCNSGRNKHVWRQKFATSKQRSNQSIEDWLCELRDLATKSDFSSDCCHRCEETRILGQLVTGVFSDVDRRDMLKEGDALNLKDALIFVRTMEAAGKEANNLRDNSSTSLQQMRKSTYKKEKTTKAFEKPGASQQHKKHSTFGPKGSCYGCGASKRCDRGKCPAFGRECRKCGRQNHFEKTCRSKPRVEEITARKPKVAAISAADRVDIRISPLKRGHPSWTISTLPDSGSEIDAIPGELYRKLFSQIRLHKGVQPVTAVGTPITSIGNFKATVEWAPKGKQKRSVSTLIHVLEALNQPVLSKATQMKLGMLPTGYPHVQVQRIDNPTMTINRRSRSGNSEILPAERNMEAKPFEHLLSHVPSAPVVGVTEEAPSVHVDRENFVTEFQQIFDGVCRPMEGPPCHFELKDGVTPVAMRGSRPVAVPLLPRLKDELDELEQQGVIEKITAPTAWVHPIVIVPKPNGGIRLCVDFRKLNESIITPKFESMTPFQAVRTIPPGMRYFTVVDALKGYHQVPLDDESADLTTFSTPFGRYRYLRLPFGVIHAGDDYSRRVSDIFDSIPNSRRIVEDIAVFSKTYKEHVELVRLLFNRAKEHGVSLNAKKLVYAKSRVKFGGYIIDADGFRPDPDLMKAIRNFPVPGNVTDLRSFFGLCQQVGHFSNKIAAALEPLSPLLKKSYTWEWTTTHDDAFKKARDTLANVPDLAFYDPALPTALHVDASRLFGLGFVLKQQHADGKWNMVQAGSRFLSDAETRYAMIELECLAAAWGMQKCQQFIEGLDVFELVTDHKPLVPILNDYSLDKLDNPRLLRLRLKMQRYRFKARWVPGKENVDADALSRAPVDKAVPEDELAEGVTSFSPRLALICAIEGSDETVIDPAIEKVKQAAAADPIMVQLKETILSGFPNDKCNLPVSLRPYWSVRERLAVDDQDGMVVLGARIVIPQSIRQDIIRDLLQMHQGATKLRQRARLSMYWPGMDNEIANAAQSCDECVKRLPSHAAETLRPHDPAKRPFEQIHADLGTVNGRNFLIMVDQFSGWPHVVPFANMNTSARQVIDAARQFFSNVGAPVKFWSDNGPQFKAAEFKQFLKDWQIIPGTSSPHYAQSNGRAEAEVKTMKKLIAGSSSSGTFDPDKFAKALLLFRNAPRLGGASPAQLVFNRPVRDSLPAHHRAFAAEWQSAADVLEERAKKAKHLQVEHFNRKAHDLNELEIGNHVLIQNPLTKQWDTTGIIVELGPNRDYLIKTEAGRVYRRNRRFLRRRIVVMPGSSEVPPAVPVGEANRAAIPPPVEPQPEQPQAVQPPNLRRSTRPKKPSRKYPSSEWLVDL